MNYKDDGLGKVHFTERKNQSIDFSNIRLGNIVPCDIDLLCEVRKKFTIEYRNKAWIFIEFKYRDTPFPFGQRLMYERLVDDFTKLGKPSISILAEHNCTDPKTTVDASKCTVREVYWHGKWYKINDEPPILLDRAIRNFIKNELG